MEFEYGRPLSIVFIKNVFGPVPETSLLARKLINDWRSRCPSEIVLDSDGKNLTNEALVFHESLHGITGEIDNGIQRLLLGSSGVTAGGSSNISDFLRTNIL